MKFEYTFVALLALASSAIAAPIEVGAREATPDALPEAEPAKREAAPDAAPQGYGSYSGYGEYVPPAGGYGRYGDYGEYSPPAGGYASYGTYKKE
jgi:hypothetical protein